MKRILLTLLLFVSLGAMAQSQWEKPLSPKEQLEQARKAQDEARKAMKEARKKAREAAKLAKKAGLDRKEARAEIAELKEKSKSSKKAGKSKDKKYLAPNAVPEVDGKVVFTLSLDVPGKSAQQIYDATYAFLDSLARESNQIESSVVLINKQEHIIAAKYSEWMEFMRNFIALDRTKFNYTIIATCTDGHLEATLERITYNYEEDRPTGFKIGAEKWITDKFAVNKKHTKLLPGSAKFRRKTIDRKNQIFDSLTKVLNNASK